MNYTFSFIITLSLHAILAILTVFILSESEQNKNHEKVHRLILQSPKVLIQNSTGQQKKTLHSQHSQNYLKHEEMSKANGSESAPIIHDQQTQSNALISTTTNSLEQKNNSTSGESGQILEQFSKSALYLGMLKPFLDNFFSQENFEDKHLQFKIHLHFINEHLEVNILSDELDRKIKIKLIRELKKNQDIQYLKNELQQKYQTNELIIPVKINSEVYK